MGDVVLLVTGARAYARDGAALSWAQLAILAAITDALRTGRVRVVTGDADGIDQHARAIASGLDVAGFAVPCSVYRLDGRVTHTDGANERWTDAAMVAAASALPGEHRCLALYHPASKTHGTAHTAALARRAGIVVDERTWGAT